MIANYQEHSSNERTFLAWVRTVVAVVGFGLAVARMGGHGAAVWSEFLMLVAGAAVLFLAYLRMRHVQQTDQKRSSDRRRCGADGYVSVAAADCLAFCVAGCFRVACVLNGKGLAFLPRHPVHPGFSDDHDCGERAGRNAFGHYCPRRRCTHGASAFGRSWTASCIG